MSGPDASHRRGFLAWFPQNPVAANLLMFAIIVGGVLTLTKVRFEVFPDVKPNVLLVQVDYPGATPAEVERAICMRLEDAIDGVTGIEKITSLAAEGSGSLAIETLQEADLQQVLDDVKTRVDAITTFPEEAETPIVAQVVQRKEVISVAICGDVPEETLRLLGDRARDGLAALPEITQIELTSVRPYEVSIEVSETALREHGLTFDHVADAVRRGSLDLPGGTIKSGSGQIVLRTQAQAYRGEQFAALPLLTRADGSRLLLGEVANVHDGFADVDLLSRFDGKPAVLLRIFRVGNQDALAITSAVREWVYGAGRSILPAGVQMTHWRDESVILRGRLDLLLGNAMQGLVLVVLLLALFMQVRLAFWVALGIPVSFLGAVLAMPWFDVSINLISLFAFLMVLGIVVDDAIVVSENVYRYRRRGVPAMEAALKGSHEVAVPVTASVLTTVAAFLPMFNVPGADAQIWRVIPLIVIPVLAFSLIDSKLILPAHLAAMRDERPGRSRNPWVIVQQGFQSGLDWFVARVYEPVAGLSLRWRYVTIAAFIGILMLLIGATAAGFPRFVYFPSVEGDNVVVSLTMPQGTPVAQTSAILARIETAARQVAADIDRETGTGQGILLHMLTTVGSQPYVIEQARNAGNRQATSDSGSHLAELNMQLQPSEVRTVSSDRVMTRLRQAVGDVPGAVELSFTTALFSTGKDVDVELFHADMAVLRTAAEELKDALRQRPDVLDVSDSFRAGKRELQLQIKPRAEALGLSQQDLARQVRQAFHGEEAQRIQRGRDDVKVMVRYPEDNRRSLADLDGLRIRTAAGDEVPFPEVATVIEDRAFSTITRVDQKRVLRVGGEIDDGDPNADANAVNEQLRETVLPDLCVRYPGLSFGFAGDQKKQRDTMAALGVGMMFALFLIYGLMAVPLKSYAQPLIIMTAIPFGVGGAILGHMITGFDLSILSMFGVVALAGVVVNDNIVLVDYINAQRRKGMAIYDAVRHAGARRFRPIMLTSLTTFGGLMPLLLEKSVQARFLIPMAISLGFGVVFATLLSLLLVPAIYVVLDDLRRAWRWLYGGGRQTAVLAELPVAGSLDADDD